jgi:TonB-dependent starch-binding outer membrane protein SusC
MKNTFLLSICLIFAQLLSAQNSQVSGIVTAAEDGLPLPGVSISIQGGNGISTITDEDGHYSIKAAPGKSLVFSYIGFKRLVKETTNSSTLNVTLESNTSVLNEVVAIGYGTMKKSDLTGAVTSISANQIKRVPVSGMDQALQGRAAGVTVNANSGQPGASAQVRVRGIGTVLSSCNPIYVVDGVILDDISFLSPSDMESTEILKDASATAIFGSRGANGVILITTKRGSNNPKGNITVDSYFGVQNRWNKLDLMKRDEFAQTVSTLNGSNDYLTTNGLNKWIEAYYTGKKSPYFPKIKSDSYPTGIDYTTIDTDWQDEVFENNATIQNHYISFDGGTEASSYAISGSWFDQNGTIIGSNYKRLTLRVNTSHKIRTWLKVGENLSFMSSTGRNAMNNNASPGASILSAALAMAPWDPTHYPDGSWSYSTAAKGSYPKGRDLSGQIAASSNFKNVVNPFSMVENSEPNDKSERWVGDVYLELTPVKGLTLRSDVSMDLANNTSKLFKYAHEYSSYDLLEKNFFSSSMSHYSTIIYENTATYAQKIGKHDFSMLLGQTTQEYNYYSIGGSGSNILNATEENWLLSQTTEDQAYATDAIDRTRMFSLLGRLHYQYNNRYMATLNFRSDGSNKFPEHPWGYFPSMAFGWKISEEPFMKDIKNLDFMKLRFGWGQIGNEKISSDLFVTNMFNAGPTYVDYVLGTDQALVDGASVLTYANKGGKWETTEQWNIGVDFGLFSGLLSGNMDLFLKDTKNALLTVKGPAYAGNLNDPMANVGTVRNEGIELSLEHRHKIGPLNYSVGGNVSFIKNELTALNGGQKVWSSMVNGEYVLLCDEGLPVNTFWGYEYEGVFLSTEAAQTYTNSKGVVVQPNAAGGDAKYKDLNDDGQIDNEDKTNIGNPFPWLTYGVNASFDWKGFDMQLFFQGVYGNEIYNAVRYRTEGKGEESTLCTGMRDVWTTSNTSGSIPTPYGSTNNFLASSRFIENGAYLRLKNTQLGYTIPKDITRKIFIDRCRVYLSASNLFTLTKYTGYDPEIGTGVDFGNYPQARTFLVGLNLNF